MHAERHFNGGLASVRDARGFVGGALADLFDIGPSCALLVTSELATNAVVHVGQPYDVVLDTAGRTVTIGVHDHSSALPHLGNHDRPHGLEIVEALSLAWGTDPSPGGKTVWARLSIEPGSAIFAGHAPLS